MRYAVSVLTAFLLALAGAACLVAQPVVFINVNVLPMDDERGLEDMVVVVEDDRITHVGPMVSAIIPDNATVVEGNGRYLIPGLAEMHGHVPPPNNPNLPERYLEDVLFLYLAGGVTTVRGMLGHPNQLELRERASANELLAPNLYLAGPSFSGNSINSVEEARERVRRQHEEGWDLLKVHPGLSLQEFEAMAAEANALGIAFAGHVPSDVGLENAILMGIETVDHLDGYIDFMDARETPVTEEQLQRAVDLTREHGVWVVPTQALWETLIGAADHDALRSYEELRYMPSQVRQGWENFLGNQSQTAYYAGEAARVHAENRQRLLRALHDGGARMLMGTDAPQLFSVPGLSLRRELAKMEEAGLTPFEILVTGTRNVGEYYADRDVFGLVREGHRADLLLLSGNPLEDLSVLNRPEGVMVRGNWLPRDMLDERLAEIEAAYRD
jgi:imidazolonepropionase-like amidohydrolase